ncbi:cold-shock protein [Micromonospora avicenniae]|uniref:Cold shock protein (Beta-ribbon, CspA family) n=1 Tax=Micromonospora avicenniae TaxID=1198245 RepID=A0A1N7FSM2_9ACTN|nr:cold-shock protein [Micromonospora avicenniae]SIS03343.1 hypothetical protein SAMN05444858_1474 [Micromonospora avicenniae]
MAFGTAKWSNADKGFGFVSQDCGARLDGRENRCSPVGAHW